ncbi:hypothetical protein FA95DRAFT_606711 [Auriscalpium vulgare]|uniref:Uncharacterized protein n=1 Tax=Auriscalpium vulgare TaxID=40419 RepID=A0ACB8RDS8_9AGAM|nr:hypothetical protein FA95DRAFT_606711 [Auriscalpium vulgare]
MRGHVVHVLGHWATSYLLVVVKTGGSSRFSTQAHSAAAHLLLQDAPNDVHLRLYRFIQAMVCAQPLADREQSRSSHLRRLGPGSWTAKPASRPACEHGARAPKVLHPQYHTALAQSELVSSGSCAVSVMESCATLSCGWVESPMHPRNPAKSTCCWTVKC